MGPAHPRHARRLPRRLHDDGRGFARYARACRRLRRVSEDGARGRGTDFDRDVTVSVFETNIRVLGGLLSARMLLEGDQAVFAAET